MIGRFDPRSTSSPVFFCRAVLSRASLLRARSAELPEDLAAGLERLAPGRLVEAVGDDAVAEAVPPGLEGHAEPVGDALRRGGRAVAQLELARIARGHHHEGHVERPAPLAPLAEARLERPAPLDLPPRRLPDARGERQPLRRQLEDAPADAEVAHPFLVEEAEGDLHLGLAFGPLRHVDL